MKHTFEINMTNGSIKGKMLIFALPLILTNVLQMMFNAVDMIVAGRFIGDDALAAVGSNSSLINLLISVFIGIAMGINVTAAQYYGAGKRKSVTETACTAVLLAIICGILLAILAIVGAQTFLRWMDVPDEIMPLSLTYLRVYFIGMPAVMLYNFCSALLRAVGDTRRPMYILMMAGIINVVLDILFVQVFHFGIAGIAVATVISQFVSGACVMACVLASGLLMNLNDSKIGIYKEPLIKILRLGLPSGVQGALFSVSNVLIQSAINGFGAAVVAGNTAAVNIENYVYYTMNGFSQATLSFCSQNYGAGDRKRIKKSIWASVVYVIISGVIVGGLCMLCGSFLMHIFTDNEQAVALGVRRLHIICSTYFLCGLMEVMVSSMRGMGISLSPMLVSLAGACGFRILWLRTVFQIPRFHIVDVVFLSYPVTWLVTFAAQMVMLMFFWRRKREGSSKDVVQGACRNRRYQGEPCSQVQSSWSHREDA